MLLRKLANVFVEIWVLLGITLLLLVGLEIGARIVFALRDVWQSAGSAQLIERSLGADVYRGQDWAEDYWREANQTVQTAHANWHSYVYWRRKPYQGKYIVIDDDGIRRTWNKSSAPSSTQLKIFMFGGSALWGTGARDEFTIPSLVSKKLQAKNVDVWVTNFGEGGYVSTQEVIVLMIELQKGNVPDVVVFYDGVNDTFSAFQQGVAGIPQNEYNRVWSFGGLNWRGEVIEKLALYRAVRGLVSSRQGKATEKSDAQLANAVLDVYSSNMQIVQALAQEYGFAATFYWQPVVYTKKTLSAWEKQELDRYGEARFFKHVYQDANQKLGTNGCGNFHDLSSAFSDEAGTVFIDAFHTSEAGNDQVADLIVQTLPQVTPRRK